ncbi:MAG: YlxR family protein [Beutenbergiaceae bacterium]
MATGGAKVAGMRTCAGCRAKAHRSDLVRLVVDRQLAELTVVVDPRAVLPGRGVWLHPQQDCLDRAQSRRAIARGLRLAQELSLAQVHVWFGRHA